ncbi:MAG: AI-2E family transporter [Archangium sp.]|nr:AI-2E family transporter [Archangium sp.]
MTPPSGPNPTLRIEVSLKTMLLAVAVLAGTWILITLVPVALALVVALIFAGTLNPAVQWFERHQVRRELALVVVFGVSALVVGALALLIFPSLTEQLLNYAAKVPELQASLAAALGEFRSLSSASEAVKNFDPGTLMTGGVTRLASASGGVLEFLGYLASSLVLALYFVADRERVRGGLYSLVPRGHHVRLAHILNRLETIVGGYMRGQLITSVAIFLFTWALLTACQVPGALALAAFAGLTDVIPFVGGLIAMTPATLAAVAVGPWVGVIVLVAMFVYMEFESRILVPRVYGHILRLPSVVVVVALLIGGRLLGIIGAVIALPVAAALRMLFEELRVELPGEDHDGHLVQQQDASDQREYERQTAGVTAHAAAEVAGQIADKTDAEESARG